MKRLVLCGGALLLIGVSDVAQSLLVSPYTVGECWDCAGGKSCPKPIGAVDGGNTVFTLRRLPMGQAAVDVYLNGIHERIDADYKLSGTTLTLLTAPAAGDSIDVRYRGNYTANVPAQ
jgi:hypothetical protein